MSIQALRRAVPALARSFSTTPKPLALAGLVRRTPIAVKSTPAPAPTPVPSAAASTQASSIPDDMPPFDDFDPSDPPAPSQPRSSSSFTPRSSSSSSSSSSSPSSLLETPSPPLQSFPNDQYEPLPFASGGIPGEQSGPDWKTSFAGLSEIPFSKEAADTLLGPIKPHDVEVKPDGILYLPEIKYRRILNLAFGPGGWGLAPRGQTFVTGNTVTREWGLVCLGRLVSVARGEQEFFGDATKVPTAVEACKSNALMRCCKDLGIASELWDPRFIREFKAKHAIEVFVENGGRKKKMWRRRDSPPFEFPWKEKK